jgi:medium-chain acyl-[acyl-carrier-protein] hydrolase
VTIDGAVVDAWLGTARASSAAAVTLLCLPHAGGGAVVYQPWRRLLPDVAVLPVLLPGREQRLDERPIDDLDALVRLIADVVAARVRPPFALFGHSFGALAAFELARELRRRGGPQPLCLFASGCPAPSIATGGLALHQLPDDALLAAVASRYGGVPAAILAERELRALFVPALRADLRMSELYRYRPEPPLAFPIFALGGRDDARATVAALEPWGRETLSPAAVELFPGGHFFVSTARELVVGAVARRLRGLAQDDSQGSRP